MGRSVLISVAAPGNGKSDPPQPSILAEYILFPFYDHLVARYFPRSWQPNTITLTGVALTLSASLLLLASMPAGARFVPGRADWRPNSLVLPGGGADYISPLYPSVIEPIVPGVSTPVFMAACGLLNLLYCIADNTDGRLARRDRKFSPYGEYLDHGLDCVSSLLSACLIFCVMGGSLANMSVAVGLIAMVTVLSHTLNYEKNIFIWGNRLATVDEAMLFFALAPCIPLVLPDINTAPLPQWMVAAAAFFKPSLRATLAPLKFIDFLLCVYGVIQAQATAHIASMHWRMLLRLPVLALMLTCVVMWACIAPHSAHLEAVFQQRGVTGPVAPGSRSRNGKSNSNSNNSSAAGHVPGYTLGPFAYPAVWIVTMAVTASICVHVLIAAKCAQTRTADAFPLAGVVFVLLTFMVCPAGAMLLGVAFHAGQIMYNIRFITARKAAAAAEAAAAAQATAAAPSDKK